MRVLSGIFGAIILLASACRTSPLLPKEIPNISYSTAGTFESGSFDSVTYQNSYFGFSIKAPQNNWVVLSQTQAAEPFHQNCKIMSQKGVSDSAIRNTENNNFILFTLQKTPVTTAPSFQYINFIAEGLNKVPNVTNAIEYVKWTQKTVETTLASGFPKYSILGIDTAAIGNRTFITLLMQIERADGVTYYQKCYTAQFGEHVLNIITNYKTPEELSDNNKVLETVKWN